MVTECLCYYRNGAVYITNVSEHINDLSTLVSL